MNTSGKCGSLNRYLVKAFGRIGAACRAGFLIVMVPDRTGRPALARLFSPRAGGGGRAMIARRLVLLPVLLWLLVPVLATGAHADNGIADLIEVSGRLSPETRLYPETAAHPGQRSHASGFAAEATVYMEDDEGRSITITPFFRYDAGRSRPHPRRSSRGLSSLVRRCRR